MSDLRPVRTGIAVTIGGDIVLTDKHVGTQPSYLKLARPGTRDNPKAAETLAFEIGRDIIRQQAPRHSFLGSETELIGRYAVSRGVFREAIRILEYHALVQARRGPNGGIFVGDPDAGAVTAATALFLEYERVDPRQLYNTRAALELYAVGLATEMLDDVGEARLRACLEDGQSTRDPENFVQRNDFHRTICDLTENKPLGLFVDVCQTLTFMHSFALEEGARQRTPEELAEEIQAEHTGIVEAMVARDVDQARSLMDAHLRTMLPWLR